MVFASRIACLQFLLLVLQAACSCLGCSVAGASCPTDAQGRRNGTHPLGDGGPACWRAPGEELENQTIPFGGGPRTLDPDIYIYMIPAPRPQTKF